MRKEEAAVDLRDRNKRVVVILLGWVALLMAVSLAVGIRW